MGCSSAKILILAFLEHFGYFWEYNLAALIPSIVMLRAADIQGYPSQAGKSPKTNLQRRGNEQFGSAQNGRQLGVGFYGDRRRVFGMSYFKSGPQLP